MERHTKNWLGKWKVIILFGSLLFLSSIALAEQNDTTFSTASEKEETTLSLTDTIPSFSNRFIHRVGFEARPEYVLPSNSLLKGKYYYKAIEQAFSAHLRYSFQFLPNSCADQLYGGAYQGIGLSYYTFGEKDLLGNPVALYLYQGARIARFNPRLSLNYEWNFGVSFGWNPYDPNQNPENIIISSKANAYLNLNFYMNWALSHQFDLTAGAAISHFSNGNTKLPNAGLNTTGLKIGLVYNFNRPKNFLSQPAQKRPVPEFERHVSYDLVLFGSWRRKVFGESDESIVLSDAYTVLGFNFAPMYNLNHRFRVGASLDGVYDGSANIYTADYIIGTEQPFYRPAASKQMALGISGRAEYVMPYFTIGVGVGTNVLHRGGDLKAFYQIASLKIDATRNSFIHIGYSLHDFHNPNFLMLGIGYRFNNKSKSYKP